MKKILVIDDEQDVLDLVEAVLVTRGHEVITTLDGEEGLVIAERDRPNLIICDFMMPRVSGLEFLRRLRTNARIRATPVFMLSNIVSEDKPPEFWIRSLAVDDYITKPFDPLDLLGRVEYFFRKDGYISSSRAEDDNGPFIHPATQNVTRPFVDLANATPSEIVHYFIDAWNRQDFTMEFNCLSDEMLNGLTQDKYVAARRRHYAESGDFDLRQRVSKVLEEKSSLNVAKVVIEREENRPTGKTMRRETYSLKKTHKGWKILTSRSEKIDAEG